MVHISFKYRPNRVPVVAKGIIAATGSILIGTVLDELAPMAGHRSRYLCCRFAQHLGRGDLPDAARVLKRAARRLDTGSD